MDRMQELCLTASDETLHVVHGAIEAHLDKNHCPDEIKIQILIAVEEIYVNIAHYAYGGKLGEVRVRAEADRDTDIYRVEFRDRGIPYNPLEKEDPDIMLSADEREIGGLGIYMVKQSMDRVSYRYEDGCNILSIEKSLAAAAV